MELPKINKPNRGMFDGIKNKLGFTSDQRDDDYDDNYYDDPDADYGEYGDDYDDDGYGGEFDDDSYGGYGQSATSSSSYSSSRPRLVSIDDVRANTQVPDSLNRDPLPERRVSPVPTSAYRSTGTTSSRSSYTRPGREVERAADYMISSNTSDVAPAHSAPTYSAPPKSASYESMYSTAATLAGTAGATSNQSTYDPYDAYSGAGATSHNPSRSLSVLKPVSYGEVERIAKIVKAGDVVVLSLRNTPDHLAKRILDFSFGVSSALDASVECIADKVFVVIRGRALGEDEKMSLRNQGVI